MKSTITSRQLPRVKPLAFRQVKPVLDKSVSGCRVASVSSVMSMADASVVRRVALSAGAVRSPNQAGNISHLPFRW